MNAVEAPRRVMTVVHGACIAVMIAALLVVAGKTISAAPFAVGIVTYPFQVDDAEGVILSEATLIRQGIDPYARQPSPAPYFYAGPYPPVYTLINAAGIGALGPTFKVGRVAQLLATVAVAAWIGWAVVGGPRSSGVAVWIVGVWAALLWFSTHLVAVWGVLIRPDMTALALNLTGVVILRRWWGCARIPSRVEAWPQGRNLRIAALGAACFALGWWTKQTFVAVPIAFVLALAWARPRAAVTIAGWYGAFVILPFLCFTFVTGGGFAQKIVGYQGSWQWEAFWRLAEPFLARYGVLLVAALLVGIIWTLLARVPTFPVLWFLGAGVAALGAGTSGGNHNHFVELLAAAVLLVGQAVRVGMRGADESTGIALGRRRTFALAATLVLVVLLTGGAALEGEGRHGWLAREYSVPGARERAGTAAVAAYLANAPAPVYSDNVGILVVARQPVLVTDPFTMAAEVRLGRWDDRDLVAAVAEGKISVIAIRERELDPEHPPTDMTPGLVRAIQARYRLAERNVLNLYVPK